MLWDESNAGLVIAMNSLAEGYWDTFVIRFFGLLWGSYLSGSYAGLSSTLDHVEGRL